MKEKALEFRKKRGWDKYHTGERLAAKLAIEAAEIMELFEWGKVPLVKELEEEIADVQIILWFLAHDRGINIDQAVQNKLNKIENDKETYPIDEHLQWTPKDNDGDAL